MMCTVRTVWKGAWYSPFWVGSELTPVNDSKSQDGSEG
jgi:hypothetical protein